jgi:hypothetical protein
MDMEPDVTPIRTTIETTAREERPKFFAPRWLMAAKDRAIRNTAAT